MKQWDWDKNNRDPKKIKKSSKEKIFWKCEKNSEHTWSAQVTSRIYSNSHCPYCSGLYVTRENSIGIKFPHLLQEWDYNKNKTLDPFKIGIASNKAINWICKKDNRHEWRTTIWHRAIDGTNCPYCSGRNATADRNIVKSNPSFFKEWNYKKNTSVNPNNVLMRSGIKVWWVCKKGHEWKASPHLRSSGNGCPSCSQIELIDGTVVASLIEGYYYLILKNNGVKFLHNKRYSDKTKNRFDFYIPESNTYIEVTSFTKDNKYSVCDKSFYIKYLKKIVRKRKFVKLIGGNFQFIQRHLSMKEKNLVRKYSI